jgi:DNA-binding MarR family transcriptional regulator
MTTEAAAHRAARIAAEVADNNSLLQHLSQTYQESITAFERYMGMSRARWAILNRLSRAEQLTQAALAQRLRVDAAAITRQVKQLEAEGLVTRWSHPEDNRFTLVALTPQGRTFVEELRSKRNSFEEIVTEGLSEKDVLHMRHYLIHMRHNIESLTQEATITQEGRAAQADALTPEI